MRTFVYGWNTFLLLTVVSMSLPHVAFAEDLSSSNYQILAPAISSGGLYATSNNYLLLGVISEFAHDIGSSATFGSNPGFVAYPFVSTPTVSATAGDSQVSLTWTASQGYVGWTVSGYDIGKSTTSGGPYTYASVGNITSSTRTGLTNGTAYYFVVIPKDAFGTRIATSTQVSATPTAPTSPPPSGGSSGGGSGGVIPPSGGTVNLSGRAYPLSTVTLLKDAQVVASSISDSKANFSMSLANLSTGNYIFSVYSEDKAGNRSSLLSFPVSVTAGATTNIGGIFLAPTIDVDKSTVKQGDNIAIFGQSAPRSEVIITVHSNTELFLKASADAIGAYLYNLDTSPLELGSHLAKSKAALAGEISSFGASVGFLVGAQNVLKSLKKVCIPADLNCDGRVNLVDFSIMAYWYKRPLAGTGLKADLNNDKKVDLIDFSILVYNWTG